MSLKRSKYESEDWANTYQFEFSGATLHKMRQSFLALLTLVSMAILIQMVLKLVESLCSCSYRRKH